MHNPNTNLPIITVQEMFKVSISITISENQVASLIYLNN